MDKWFVNKGTKFRARNQEAVYTPQVKPRNKNKSLFWYGVFGTLKQLVGVLIIVFSIFISLYLSFKNPKLFHLFWVGLGIGIYFICKGKSQRFDYQMRSGSIIHKGDW